MHTDVATTSLGAFERAIGSSFTPSPNSLRRGLAKVTAASGAYVSLSDEGVSSRHTANGAFSSSKTRRATSPTHTAFVEHMEVVQRAASNSSAASDVHPRVESMDMQAQKASSAVFKQSPDQLLRGSTKTAAASGRYIQFNGNKSAQRSPKPSAVFVPKPDALRRGHDKATVGKSQMIISPRFFIILPPPKKSLWDVFLRPSTDGCVLNPESNKRLTPISFMIALPGRIRGVRQLRGSAQCWFGPTPIHTRGSLRSTSHIHAATYPKPSGEPRCE